jgi:hypothetical protein
MTELILLGAALFSTVVLYPQQATLRPLARRGRRPQASEINPAKKPTYRGREVSKESSSPSSSGRTMNVINHRIYFRDLTGLPRQTYREMRRVTHGVTP